MRPTQVMHTPRNGLLPQSLIKQAMLGTEAAPAMPSGALAEAAVRPLLPDAESASSAAARLLTLAGSVALWRQCGHTPRQHPHTQVERSAQDERPLVGDLAVQHFLQMRSGEHRICLHEWLAVVQARGYRLPDELLPILLAFGLEKPPYLEALRAVIGERGRWLARQRPELMWRAVAEAAPQGYSLHGSSRYSSEIIMGWLRKTDPAQSRRYFSQVVMKREEPIKADCLRVFRINLGAEDVDFLLGLLSDTGLQLLAGRLLVQQGDNPFAAAVQAVVPPLLKLAKTPDGHLRVGAGGANKAFKSFVSIYGHSWFFHQAVGLLPPAYWCDHWGITLAQLLQAVSHSDFQDSLMAAFAVSAKELHDSEYAFHVLMHRQLYQLSRQHQLMLGMVLLPGQVEALLSKHYAQVKMLKQNPSTGTEADVEDMIVDMHGHVWSSDLTQQFMAAVRRSIAGKAKTGPYKSSLLSMHLDAAAALAAPATLREFQALLHEALLPLFDQDASLQKIADQLRFRRVMLNALGERV